MFKHMRSQWDGLRPSVSLCGGSSLYDLLTLGGHIVSYTWEMKSRSDQNLGHLAISVALFSFSLQVLSWSFLHEQSPLQALSTNIWGWRYLTCNKTFCLFLKECENSPGRFKSNNQGQPIHRWKSLGSELHLWECLCHSCLSKQINQPTLVLFYSATAWQLCSHAAFA